jgi:alpha-1,3-mannosyltransferase
VVCILKNKSPAISILCFSVGASIKMNALLWAPGVAYHFLMQIGLKKTLLAARAGLLWQLLVGSPFLLTYPRSYIKNSWNLGRQFAWFNSVNWKWLPRSVFYSHWFHATLMCLHLFFLAVILYEARYDRSALPTPASDKKPISNFHTSAMLCATHFTGFIFARNLHYSFYIWVFHTLPLLYHAGGVPWSIRPFLALAIEIAYNGWHQYKGDELDSCGR